MHDANGKSLAVGDLVSIPCKILECNTGEDYCNVTVESVHGRRPDGAKERFSAFNTGVVEKVEPKADESALMKLIQAALPQGEPAPEGACASAGPPKSLSDGHDLVHALLMGCFDQFLRSHGIEVELDKITPQQVQEIVQLICSVAVPLCQAAGTSKLADK